MARSDVVDRRCGRRRRRGRRRRGSSRRRSMLDLEVAGADPERDGQLGDDRPSRNARTHPSRDPRSPGRPARGAGRGRGRRARPVGRNAPRRRDAAIRRAVRRTRTTPRCDSSSSVEPTGGRAGPRRPRRASRRGSWRPGRSRSTRPGRRSARPRPRCRPAGGRTVPGQQDGVVGTDGPAPSRGPGGGGIGASDARDRRQPSSVAWGSQSNVSAAPASSIRRTPGGRNASSASSNVDFPVPWPRRRRRCGTRPRSAARASPRARHRGCRHRSAPRWIEAGAEAGGRPTGSRS